jgi:ferredoxin
MSFFEKARARPGHESCSGCGLCLLACPVWRQTHDLRLTPQGRAKALQHGVEPGSLRSSVASCTLCGACEPACPENLPLVDMLLKLRSEMPLERDVVLAKMATAPRAAPAASGMVLLPGAALGQDAARLARALSLLNASCAGDDGADIALAIEAGVPVPTHRLDRFLSPLRSARRLIVADGLLLRELRRWLPKMKMSGVGEALSRLAPLRAKLRASDLYVIEPRAFHADYQRLVGHYDALRLAFGGAMNLDLQRLAVPTTASAAQHALGAAAIDAREQARWILEGRRFERVVVEDASDCAAFAAVTEKPVLHLADL